MRRRQYLGLSGPLLVGLAGCTAVTDALQSEAYDKGEKELLLPDGVGEDWPDRDLQPNHDLNEHFERVWTTPDESVLVMMTAEVTESISAAKDTFERSEATLREPREYPLADEALISDDGETARCVFRHSNALGQTVAARESGTEVRPDRQRAGTYAELMFREWPENNA